ncbi:hypothetical protein BDR26DRAFT_915324 [Obelidium mucronatum]|nr:hypothetical protein BDR26DRAFT_915324 [Obelidium mucronatum]
MNTGESVATNSGTKRVRNVKYEGMEDDISSGSEHEPDHLHHDHHQDMMEDTDGGGSPTTSTSTGGQKTRKKPGRKQVNTKPADKRTAQNRIAQRLFRERKQNYVKELEQKIEELTEIISGNPQLSVTGDILALTKRVSELEQENQNLKKETNNNTLAPNPPTYTACTQCTAEKLRTKEIASRNQELELKVFDLQSECNNLRIAISILGQSPQPQHHSPLSVPIGSAAVISPLSLGLNQDFMNPSSTLITPNIALPMRPLQTTTTMPFSSAANFSNIQQQQHQQQQQPMIHLKNDLRSYTGSPQPQPPSLRTPHTPLTVPTSPRSDDWYDVARNGEVLVPAVDLFGPVHVEAQRFALKRIPALSESSKYVDELMDILIALSKCSSRRMNKKLMVRLYAVKHRLMDACVHVMERQQVIEIFELFRTQHRNHMNHFYQNLLIGRPDSLASQPPTEAQTKILTTLKPFNETVKAIPSLQSATSLIDELCFEFSTQMLVSDPLQKEDKFVYMMGLTGQIQAMCGTEEERTRFMLAMEIARERTRKYMDEYAFVETKIHE